MANAGSRGDAAIAVEPGEGELLSLEEAAQLLGTSATTVYRMLKQNDLRGLKVGRQWRFRRQDLTAYLDRSQRAVEVASLEGLADEIAFFWSGEASQCGLPAPDGTVEPEIKQLLYGILAFGLAAGASDIHLEPMEQAGETFLLVRLRVDGGLREARRMPIRLQPALLKSLQRLAGIEAAREGRPVEGRFHLACRPPWLQREERFQFHVHCLPTPRGVDASIRVCLPPASVVRGLEPVDMTPEQRSQIREWLQHRHGLILTTGLGHSKELLYNCLSERVGPERKTIVVEECPEHALPYTTSVLLNRQTGITPADALRAVHNHDPDMIMLESTGDAETVRLAHELAFTEYLVLTSVPANHAARAVHWLLEQQVEPLVVARTLLGIVAQWQARRICDGCREPVERSDRDTVFARVRRIAAEGGYEIPPNARFYQGCGCDRCGYRGYLGRVELFEVMPWSDTLTDALLRGATVEELTRIAVGQGIRTLLADGICKAVEGKTTLNEVLLAGMGSI